MFSDRSPELYLGAHIHKERLDMLVLSACSPKGHKLGGELQEHLVFPKRIWRGFQRTSI